VLLAQEAASQTLPLQPGAYSPQPARARVGG